MPWVKRAEKPFYKVERLLRGYGMNGVMMGKALNVSHVTGLRRLENPETLTLAEIDRISRFAHIPIEELREAISRS